MTILDKAPALMVMLERQVFPIRSGEDIVRLRHVVRGKAMALGFSLTEQTKFVTAASELARNALIYGGGGDAHLFTPESNGRMGLRLEFIDQGPGIPDIAKALKDGFSSGSGLGLGLGGAKRLCDEFYIRSTLGAGSHIAIVKWKSVRTEQGRTTRQSGQTEVL